MATSHVQDIVEDTDTGSDDHPPPLINEDSEDVDSETEISQLQNDRSYTSRSSGNPIGQGAAVATAKSDANLHCPAASVHAADLSGLSPGCEDDNDSLPDLCDDSASTDGQDYADEHIYLHPSALHSARATKVGGRWFGCTTAVSPIEQPSVGQHATRPGAPSLISPP